jgi:hypothetical protein
MELATTVALAALRGPVPLAKTLAALDVLSDGRVVAGVGPGSSERDYAAVAVPYEERWQRFDEAVGGREARAGQGDSLGKEVGFAWVPDAKALQPGQKAEFTVDSHRDASAALLKKLRVVMADNGNFMRVSMSGDDPQRTADIVNGLTSQFVELAADEAGQAPRDGHGPLEQLQYSATQLRDAETALEGFRVKTITLPSDVPVAAGLTMTQPTVISSTSIRRSGRPPSRATERRLPRRSTSSHLAPPRPTPSARSPQFAVHRSSAAPSTAMSNAEASLRVMRSGSPASTSRYRNSRPDQRIPPGYPRPRVAAYHSDAAGRALYRHSDCDVVQDLQSIPQRSINEQRLTREMLGAEGLYRNLQQRYEEAKPAEASALPDVRVLDPAVAPTRPDANDRLRLIAMGALGSLAFALWPAILLDRFDRRFRYPTR